MKSSKCSKVIIYIVFFISLSCLFTNLRALDLISFNRNDNSSNDTNYYYETNDFFDILKNYNEALLEKFRIEQAMESKDFKKELDEIDKAYKEELGIFEKKILDNPKLKEEINEEDEKSNINNKYYQLKEELKQKYNINDYDIKDINDYLSRIGNINYVVKDKNSDKFISNYLENTDINELEKLTSLGNNDFYMTVRGNNTGVSEIKTNLKKNFLENNFKFYFNKDNYKSLEIYYAVPKEKKMDDEIYRLEERFKNRSRYNSSDNSLMLAFIFISTSLVLVIATGYLLYKKRNEDIEDFVWIEKKYFKSPIEVKILLILLLNSMVINLNHSVSPYNYYDNNNYYINMLLSGNYLKLIIIKAGLFFSIYLIIKYFLYLLKKYRDKTLENILDTSLIYKYWNKNSELYFQGERIEKKRKTSKLITIIVILILGAIIFVGLTEYYFLGMAAYVIIILLIFHILKMYRDLKNIANATYKMSNGDLNISIPEEGNILTKFLAKNINNINKGFKSAVEKEIRSERMKGELITNVSHDLKTPLTSIINYVDLLKDEGLDMDRKIQYIDILDRKSKRLKVLIEDLFEASKASSRNMELQLEEVDIVALLRQTLGEFRDKIDESNLNFKIDIPKKKIYLMLDGKKTWRIFENLIINILKYSMKGSRVYIDLVEEDEEVKIIMKNMSAYEMNFKESEILERFTRGDESRNTEGSGLGLAIAKSLVELQGGKFNLDIDGDLFKVTITLIKDNHNSV